MNSAIPVTRTARPRIVRRPLHGVLLLDKPVGLSSNQALQQAKYLLRAEKAGHTGTLDPLASGVLPLCFGAATKFSQWQLDADKTYLAHARLGQTTSSGDSEGEILQQRPVLPAAVSSARLAAIRARFSGRIVQIPPMHSALKKDGKPLYALARAGQTVERAPRHVTIHALEFPEAVAGDILTLHVHCSKGTYIRTLVEDIGEALGCGAHLAALRRTASGPFGIARCLVLRAQDAPQNPVGTLEGMDEAQRAQQLLPVQSLLHGIPAVHLQAQDAARFLTGLRRRIDQPDAAAVAVFGRNPHALLGLAHIQNGELIADRLLNPVEIAQMVQAGQG